MHTDRDGLAELTSYLDTTDTVLESLVLDLLSFDTQNPPGTTEQAIAFIREYLTAAGLDPRTVTVDPAKPNLVVEIPGRTDHTLIYNGHVDTVPFDRDAWDYDPLGEAVDDRIYGRGATDMKGQLATMLQVVAAFAETGVRPPVTLVLTAVSDEEVPSEAGLGALLEQGDLEGDACVIGETTCENGRYSLTVADKGSIWLTLEASGSGAHGSRPMMGENAIDTLYDAIDDLRTSLTGRETRTDAGLEPILAESVEFYEPRLGPMQAERLFRHPTVNLGHISGGDSINAVPERATAGLDIRLAAGVDTEAVLSDIRDCLDRHPRVRITEQSWSVGTYESPESPIVRATDAIASDLLGERIYLRSATGGGDAKRLREAGISTIEFGLGTDTVHARNEYITRRALQMNRSFFARLPYSFAAEVGE